MGPPSGVQWHRDLAWSTACLGPDHCLRRTGVGRGVRASNGGVPAAGDAAGPAIAGLARTSRGRRRHRSRCLLGGLARSSRVSRRFRVDLLGAQYRDSAGAERSSESVAPRAALAGSASLVAGLGGGCAIRGWSFRGWVFRGWVFRGWVFRGWRAGRPNAGCSCCSGSRRSRAPGAAVLGRPLCGRDRGADDLGARRCGCAVESRAQAIACAAC